ncbi:ABC transporter permease, partial [Mycoplasmoides pneumoniae]
MRNLIKNVFRSFRTAKIALIALTFLIFVAVGSFVLLNNTVNNFNASFQHVTEQGQLSNAIINERYDFGKLEFQKTSNDATSSAQPSVSTRSTLTAQKANGANSSFTLTLTPDSRTSFINNALQLKPDVYNSLVTVTFSYGSESDQTKKTQIEEQSKLIAANNLSRALQTDKELLVTGQLEQLKATFRTYKAINITDQGVFKKLIASEPTDQVNRLVLFDGHQLARSRQVEFNELFSQFTQVQAKGKDQLSTTLKNGNYEQLLQAIAN